MELITAENAFFVGVGAFCVAAAIVAAASLLMWLYVSNRPD